MHELYDHSKIEPKWQEAWEKAEAFKTPELGPNDEKAYILDFFPYPSGSGLHVGHLLGYTGSDVAARMARMKGKKVLHPMGWDAFGLPAENYAIKHGVHPAISTKENIAEYRRQLTQAGISYDWSKEITTFEPEYYRWTQWFFSLLYKKGLAYRKDGLVNWCPHCQTVLANEQVINGICERCGSTVIQKQLKQWYFKITDYAERLLQDLETLDWPEKIKSMQRNWIGKSEGAEISFSLKDLDVEIPVFTTRPDTIFGATYLVLAPEHSLVSLITTESQKLAVTGYQSVVAEITELERTFLDREKTGVFTGAYAMNPATGKEIPIWIADYVLAQYGSGAIMAVPAHDERDFIFAQKFELPITRVITGGESLPYTERGILENSSQFSGRESSEVLEDLLTVISGHKKITYRLRDWLVSRQRFWGCPIPILYDADGREQLVPEGQLPVELPLDAQFLPTGQSPLIHAKNWQNVPGFTREVDTLDTFVCSSWYYLRFPTPNNSDAAFNKEEVEKWLPVDLYIGGAEHAVLHLLYARFFTKVLFDEGLISFSEPFTQLRNQGMILGPDNNKMSKSKGNVISPDDIISKYGADTLRTYELFMGPFEFEKPWSTTGIIGVRRFMEKVWKLSEKTTLESASEDELSMLHKTIKKVSEDIEAFRFNTAISSMMEAVNFFLELGTITRATYLDLLLILNPFAPHITEELWSLSGGIGFASLAPWPAYDEVLITQKTIEYPVQINGKLRFKLEVPADTDSQEVLKIAKNHPKVLELLDQMSIKKEIVVPNRLISLVIG